LQKSLTNRNATVDLITKPQIDSLIELLNDSIEKVANMIVASCLKVNM
jgi:hypothetical protein